MDARLVISRSAYALQVARNGDWEEHARLPGGAGALLPASLPGEAALERAIEVAEDWLMPHVAGWAGGMLEIEDATRVLERGLEQVLGAVGDAWSNREIEAMFLRMVDLLTGRNMPAALHDQREFVAALLLVRELVHHGKISGVRLR